MSTSTTPIPHFITAVNALTDALAALHSRATPAIRHDSFEWLDEINDLVELLDGFLSIDEINDQVDRRRQSVALTQPHHV